MRSMSRRLIAIVAVAVLLVGGGMIDRRHDHSRRVVSAAAAEPAVAGLMPTAAPPEALNSSWYCPAATAAPNGSADGLLVAFNTTDRPLTAQIAVVPSPGDTKTVTKPVGPHSTTNVWLHDVVNAPNAAAVVDFDGGGAVVDLFVIGPSGWDASPCASTASQHWYFATGSTDRDTTLSISLLNPFPEDAIVDLSFATDQGPSQPNEFQGVIVPGRGLTIVNVGDHVRRRVDVATTVTARAGRIVAGKIQTLPQPNPANIVALGAPSAGGPWMFPDGYIEPGIVEQYHLYNPNDREAKVEVSFVLDQGSAEPFELTVPPQGTLTLAANDQPRIPKGMAHSATVTSTNGVGVVAEMILSAAKPAPRLGVGGVIGARRSARRWAFAAGATNPVTDEWVVLMNPGSRPATVSFVAAAEGQQIPIEGLQAMVVPSHGRIATHLGDHIGRDPLPLVVESSEPVAAERDLYHVGGPGVSIAMGVPVG